MTVLFDVFVLGRSVARVIDDALAGTGLNGFDYAMTSMLAGHRTMTPSDIGAVTGMPATTVSGVLRRLETKGLLERRPHPVDGRATLIALTPRGSMATEEAREGFARAVDQIESRLEDLAGVRHSLQQLDDAIRSVAGTALRPYRVDPAMPPDVTELSEEQRREVAAFIAWIRHRDGAELQS